jgi:hypothetical protein
MSRLDLVTEFKKEVRQDSVDFLVRGVLGVDDRLYPLGSDTKVLSTVFEIFTRPSLLRIAARHGLKLKEAPQTIYPDFTLLRSELDQRKIAVDVKTTYRRPSIQYTLGSYTSFLRNGTKNILYPYADYCEHWIIGFAYSRRDVAPSGHFKIADRAKVPIPYTDVEWFVQEKYKIAGDSPGSGNTANIGSFRSNSINDFRDGNGPFASHGEEVFRDYWANFGRKASERPYSNFSEYQAWRARREPR